MTSRPQLARPPRRRERAVAVRPRLAHRLVGVGGAEQPGRRRDRVPGSAARVARAVQALAVLHRDRAERRQRVGLLQHPLGEVRVHAHPLPLAGAERPALVPDRVGDAEPAEVVHEAGPAQRARPRRRRARAVAPAAAARSATAAGVPERVRRLQVDEVGDGEQRGVELARRSSTTSSAGSAAMTASQVVAVVEAVEDRSRRRAQQARRARVELRARRARRARRRAASIPPTRWATSTNSASWARRDASGIALAARGRRASPGRPTARRTPPSASSTAVGQPELLGRARRASAACWAIMPSTSR